MMAKLCTKCKQSKTLEEFYNSRSSSDGHQPWCKKCQRERKKTTEYKKYQQEYEDRPQVKRRKRELESTPAARLKQQERRRSSEFKAYLRNYRQGEGFQEYRKGYASKNSDRFMLNRAKSRSIKRGVPFSVLLHEIEIPLVCPVLGIVLERGKERHTDNSPSLDRIFPDRGYVPGNIAVISQRANRIKNNGTANEHRKIAAWMRFPAVLENVVPTPKTIGKQERSLLHHAKQRAKKSGVEINIVAEDIFIPKHCPILGIDLVPGKGRLHDKSPTLDRNDPHKGYIASNVSVISHRANSLKNDGTAEEHLKIADWMDSMVSCTHYGPDGDSRELNQ